MFAASLNLVKKINTFIVTAARKEIGTVEFKGLKAFYTANLILYLYAFYLENSVHELSAAIFSPKVKYPLMKGKGNVTP